MSEQRKATLEEVARQTGLHKVTVSRILGGKYQGKAETMSRVKQAARELGYSPNLLGRAMRQQSLPVVLVQAAADPYSGGYLHAMFMRLMHTDLSLMVAYDRMRFAELREQFRPAASVLLGTTETRLQELLHSQSDVIAISTGEPRLRDVRCHSVRVEFEAGFQLLGKRLAAWGHRRCVYFYPGSMDRLGEGPGERLAGLRKGMSAAADADVEAQPVNSNEGMETALAKVMERTAAPTAVVCALDDMALRCLLYLMRRGLLVPEQVSVTGCDGLSYAAPYLTTLCVPHQEVAERVWECVEAVRAGAGRLETTVTCTQWEGSSAGPVPASQENKSKGDKP